MFGSVNLTKCSWGILTCFHVTCLPLYVCACVCVLLVSAAAALVFLCSAACSLFYSFTLIKDKFSFHSFHLCAALCFWAFNYFSMRPRKPPQNKIVAATVAAAVCLKINMTSATDAAAAYIYEICAFKKGYHVHTHTHKHTHQLKACKYLFSNPLCWHSDSGLELGVGLGTWGQGLTCIYVARTLARDLWSRLGRSADLLPQFKQS